MDGVGEDGMPNDEINVKGIIYDVLYEQNGLKQLISAVVLLLAGQYDITNYDVVYKFLGVLTYFEGEDEAKQTTLNSAIEKLDAIITREAVELIPMFIAEDATGIVGDLRKAAVNSNDLSDMISYLLNTLLFTEENYDKLIGVIVKAISGALSEDLCGTLNDLLGIDLAPKAFAEATENDAIIAFVGEAKTWADVWAAHSDADGNAVKYTWNLAGADGKLSADEFVTAVLDLLKPLNPVLDFILANGAITLLPDENGNATVSLPGGNAYNTALVPLFKALGVDLADAATSTDALDKLVDGLLGDQGNTIADGLVEKLGAAPLKTIIELVAGLSYLLANDNLEPLIKNLLAPVFSILDLLEPVISRAQLDAILKSVLVIGGKGYGLTDLLTIGNNGGANLVAMLNDLIGGLEVKDADGNVVDTINLLPDNFFVELSKYAVKVTDPADLVDPDDVGTVVTAWNYDAAEALMYVLDTVFTENFLKVLANMIKPDAPEGDTVTTIITGLADKEMKVVGLLLMLLDNYTVSYKKIPQTDLDGSKNTDYSAFENGKDEDNDGIDDNVEAIEEALPDAITALDALLGTVLGLLGQDSDLGALVDGLVSGADLGNLITGLLVPVLADLDIDAILGYVKDLTNLDLKIDPQTFATSAKFGSKLADFIGDAETWAEVEENYAEYVYTYEVTNEDGTTSTVTVKSDDADLDGTDYTVGEGEDAKTYTLTKKTEEVTTTDADGNETTETVHVKAFDADYDFGIKTLEDVVNFAADLLMPLDVVFQILLCGEQIIALEDEDTVRRADIRINGGYGYNYALIPLLEALGADALSQAEYEAAAETAGSSLKPVLDMIVSRVDTILAAPISEVLGLVANLFYFIGSEGINTIVANLVAPVTELLDAVCEVYPISVFVGLDDNNAFKFDFDIKNEKGLDPGFVFDLSADDLNALIGGLLSGIEINGEALGLTLNLNWLDLAAQMAKRDASGNIIYTDSAMVYTYKDTTAVGAEDVNDPYKNISGDPADSLVTILNAVLTEENVAVIKELVLGLLGDAELDPTLEGLINDILSDPDGIINLVGTVVLVLTGEYDITVLEMFFKYLGDVDYGVDNADKAIETLDRLIGKAVPVVLPLIAGEDTDPESLMGKITAAAGNVPEGIPVLTHIIDTLLADMLFTDKMMQTVTDLIVGTLGGALSESLCSTLYDVLGIDLSPVGFATASGNDTFAGYLLNDATGNAIVGTGSAILDEDGKETGAKTLTWADVIAAHKHVDTKGTEDTADDVVTYDPIFTGVDTKEEFLGNIFDMIQVVEPVLAFLLTGGDLEIAKGYGVDNIKLLGNEGYANAIYYLFKGLGLEEMGAEWNDLGADDDAIDALRYTIDYVFTLVETLGEAPFDTILVLVANLSYLIANDGVEVILSNLVSPVLSLVDALESTISRAELDALIEALVKVDLLGKPLNITNILTIAGDNGKVLVDLINGLLPNIEVTDDEGNVIHTINALPDTFFVDLAKAAIEVDAFADSTKTEIGDEVKTWHVDTGDALMHVLKTVLTEDFLEILCKALKLEAKNEDGTDNMVYGIINSLAGKDEELLDVLLSLLVKYLVEYEVYGVEGTDGSIAQPVLDKIDNIADAEKKDQFANVVENLDALIPTILGLVGLKDSAGNAVTSLEGLVNGFLTDDIANMLVGMITELLAGLPSETIDMILGYVTELTSLTDLDITPKAFANNDFGSNVKAFFEASVRAYNAAHAADENFTAVTIDTITWAQVWEVNSKEIADDPATEAVESGREFIGYTWGVTGLADIVNILCDFIQPLDPILALLLMGGQEKAVFDKNGGTSTGLSLSVLDEINVMGGMGYNYSIIPLLELLGIDAMSQDAYNDAVAANHGSVLYPILNQIVEKVSGEDGVLANPVSWLASILANLCYVLGTDDITTIVDNLLAPVNVLLEKVDKIFPLAIDINIGDIGNETETNKVVDLYLGKAHAGVAAGVHVRVEGVAVSALLSNLLAGVELTLNGNKVALLKDSGLNLDWLELAATAGADADGNGKVDFANTTFSTKYDIYDGDAYKTIAGDPAATFLALIETVLEAVNLDAILDGLGLDDSIKDLIDDLLEDPSKIIDAITDLFGGEVTYQPIQNDKVNISGVDYRSYLTFTEQNADIIADNIDGLIADILKTAGLGSLKDLVLSLLTPALVTNLVTTITNLLAGDSVAGILETIKGLQFTVKNDKDDEGTPLVLDLTIEGFQQALARLDLNGKHSYMKSFYNAIAGKTSWKDVDLSKVDWGFKAGDAHGFVRALAGVLTPLNELLGLLLNGEGKYLNVLGLVDIAGGNGYDYGLIPLIEALGFTASETKTALQYAEAVAADETQTLGYILDMVAKLVDKLLGSNKPVKTLLTILPNLAYYFMNDGLLLTVKNILAPVYNVLNLVLPILGVDLESFLKIEELVHNIDLGIVILDNKYNFHIPVIDWRGLVEKGGDSTKEVATSRTNPGNKTVGPWANSFKQKMSADDYSDYINGKDLTDARLYKNTQTNIVADAGDTLVVVLTWVFDMFGTPDNREALVQWLVDFFDLQSGAEQTVRYAINELFNKAQLYNSSDIIVSALLYALGMAVVIDSTLMGNVAQIQTIFKQLFDALGSNQECTYAAIARVMEDLTHVWEDTVGSEDDYKDAVEEQEETLNWFQRLIKKIKEFFQRIFGIFK